MLGSHTIKQQYYLSMNKPDKINLYWDRIYLKRLINKVFDYESFIALINN